MPRTGREVRRAVLWRLFVSIAVTLPPPAMAPEPPLGAQCARHGPKPEGSGFGLVGAWENRTKSNLRGGLSLSCEQILARPDAPALAFVQCGCELMHAKVGNDGARMLITARRLLPHHRVSWQERRDEDRASQDAWKKMHLVQAAVEHREVLEQIEQLRQRQARTDCAAARAIVVSLEDLPNLGATLQLLNAALSFASMTRRILVMAGLHLWQYLCFTRLELTRRRRPRCLLLCAPPVSSLHAHNTCLLFTHKHTDYDSWPMIDPGACRSRSWSCLFKPLSACSEHALASPVFEPLIRYTSQR